MKRFQVFAVLALAIVASIAYAVDPVTTAAALPGIFNPTTLAGGAIGLAAFGATNYVQEGETITMAAPYAVASGAGALVGSIFGVALQDLDNAEEGEFATCGVWDLLCVTGDAFAVGAKVYWDNGAKKCDSSSSSTSLIGIAVAVKQAGTTTVRVRLDGVAI